MGVQWRKVWATHTLEVLTRFTLILEEKRIESCTRNNCSISWLSGSTHQSPRKMYLNKLKFSSIAWKIATQKCWKSFIETVKWFSQWNSTRLTHWLSEKACSNFMRKVSPGRTLLSFSSESSLISSMTH